MSSSLTTEFLRAPKQTGILIPSSKSLARLIVASATLEHADTIVEFGPGSGTVTEQILRLKRPEATFISIEINKKLAETLKRRFPGAVIYHGSVAYVRTFLARNGKETCDRIISGLPWTMFDEALQETLLAQAHSVLSVGGIFVTYAYFPLCYLPTGKRFRRKLLEKFSTVTTTRIVWENLPPAFVYRCVK